MQMSNWVLTAMHTLFVREHNRLAEKIGAQRSNWDGDRIYEESTPISRCSDSGNNVQRIFTGAIR